VTVRTEQIDFSTVALGDSIAVNGVCLTVIEKKYHQFSADVSSETLKCTCLGHYAVGKGVNLEQALLPTTRLGGHLVSGHVDGIGRVVELKPEANILHLFIEPPLELMKYIAAKGSICVDGVSLTVNEIIGSPATRFRLTIVPHSLCNTHIDRYQLGTEVNLEVDLLARYTERLLSFEAEHCQTPPNQDKTVKKMGLTREKLNDLGFD